MNEQDQPLILGDVSARSALSDPRTRNRAILKSLLTAAVVVDSILGLLLIYFVFLHGPYFNLQQLDVTGNRRLSRAEVFEASEIEPGTNILTVDLNLIAGRLKRHPWIRSATVHRVFPGQLIIEIEERAPRAILAAEKLYYVDDRGEFFTRVLPGDSVEYPLFCGFNAQNLKSSPAEVKDFLRQGLELLDLVDRTGSGLELGEVTEVRLELDDGFTLKTESGRVIVLGKGKFERKLQRYVRLKTFLARRGEWQNAHIINLDFEDRALVRSDKSHLQG
jgi:cell division protein FtsQ